MLSPIITTLSPFLKKKSAAVQGNAVSNRLMAAVVVYFMGIILTILQSFEKDRTRYSH
jgi:hypothetical protein